MKRTTALLTGLIAGRATSAATAPAAPIATSAGLPTLTLAMNGKSIHVSGSMKAGAVIVVAKTSREEQSSPPLVKLARKVSFAQAFRQVAAHGGDTNYLDGHATITYNTAQQRGDRKGPDRPHAGPLGRARLREQQPGHMAARLVHGEQVRSSRLTAKAGGDRQDDRVRLHRSLHLARGRADPVSERRLPRPHGRRRPGQGRTGRPRPSARCCWPARTTRPRSSRPALRPSSGRPPPALSSNSGSPRRPGSTCSLALWTPRITASTPGWHGADHPHRALVDRPGQSQRKRRRSRG